jgi:hypothetical protein
VPETLKQTRTAKFDEICSTIAFAYGAAPDPNSISDVRKVDKIINAAEKSLKRTTVRGNWDVETKTKLQRLVAEHQRSHLTSRAVSRPLVRSWSNGVCWSIGASAIPRTAKLCGR